MTSLSVAVVPSASTRGTRSRAGNAMGRAREAALTGTVRAVAKYGSRKATMGDIALVAGIAKATLYNHFRTREELYAAVLVFEVEAVATSAAAVEISAADPVSRCAAVLAEAARLVGAHPAVRKIAAGEPAVLAALATPGDAPAWKLARTRVATILTAYGVPAEPIAVDLVVRFLASALLLPLAADDAASGAALLTAGLATFVAPMLTAEDVVATMDETAAQPQVPAPDASTSVLVPADTADTNS
jgi:AcrR family transcriptional regulator